MKKNRIKNEKKDKKLVKNRNINLKKEKELRDYLFSLNQVAPASKTFKFKSMRWARNSQ